MLVVFIILVCACSGSISIASDSIFGSSLGSSLGSILVLPVFFLPHISWRLACCGGTTFVDFGISKNFPVYYELRFAEGLVQH